MFLADLVCKNGKNVCLPFAAHKEAGHRQTLKTEPFYDHVAEQSRYHASGTGIRLSAGHDDRSLISDSNLLYQYRKYTE